MITITLIGSVLLLMCIPFFTFIKRKNKEFFKWGLGVDCSCYYSKPFSISNHCVTIIGFQEILEKDTTIRYSLVKKNWLGKCRIYGQVHISNDECFHIHFTHIPNDSDYQLEIFNGFNLACGEFKILGN